MKKPFSLATRKQDFNSEVFREFRCFVTFFRATPTQSRIGYIDYTKIVILLVSVSHCKRFCLVDYFECLHALCSSLAAHCSHLRYPEFSISGNAYSTTNPLQASGVLQPAESCASLPF